MGARKRQRYIIGVDLGGTNIVAGAMPEDGSLEIAMRSEPTRADQGADSVVDRIARMIDTVIAETIAETGAKRDDFAGVEPIADLLQFFINAGAYGKNLRAIGRKPR